MLDFLLVLGQIPGTGIQITLNELVLVVLVLFGRYEYKLHRAAILNYLSWASYKIGVKYRKQKRQLTGNLKLRRYRLGVSLRAVKRQIRMAIKLAYRSSIGAAILAIKRFKRQTLRRIRSMRRGFVFRTYTLPLRKIRLARRVIRRNRRAFSMGFSRRLRRVNRSISKQNRRAEKAFKLS